MAATVGPALESSIRRTPAGSTVLVTGDLDLASVPALEAQILAALETRPGHLIIDLSDVSFIDSSGVHLLERIRREARERGVALTAVAPTGPARRVFALTGRESILSASAPDSPPRFLTDWTR